MRNLRNVTRRFSLWCLDKTSGRFGLFVEITPWVVWEKISRLIHFGLFIWDNSVDHVGQY